MNITTLLIQSRRRTAAVICFVLTLTLCSCVRESKVRYEDQFVKITERSVINLANVHASRDTEVLTIWGQDFLHVRGLNPCYLTVTNTPLLLFVTGRRYENEEAVVHLADTSTHEIISIPAGRCWIGENIGRDETNNWERIIASSKTNVVIEAGSPGLEFKYFIDLTTHRVLEERL